jgi:hypothetical protein
VALVSDASLNSSAGTQLVVQSGPIVADLGGSMRQVPYTSNSTLRAKVLSGGGGSGAYSYNWSCSTADSSATCPLATYLSSQTGSTVSIDSFLLEAGVAVSVTVTISQSGTHSPAVML